MLNWSIDHIVKSWTNFFGPISDGVRTHDLRLNDRDYRVGDRMLLQEWDPALEEYTERQMIVLVTSITADHVPCAVSNVGLTPGFCILSLQVLEKIFPV